MLTCVIIIIDKHYYLLVYIITTSLFLKPTGYVHTLLDE